MRIDDRITKLAENILKNSVKLKKGEKIYIEAFSESTKDLFNEFIRIATKMGAVPFYMYNDNSFVKNLVDNANPQQIDVTMIHACGCCFLTGVGGIVPGLRL